MAAPRPVRRYLAFAALFAPLAISGCIALAREGYSSPRARGAEPILPSRRVFLEEGYPRGWTLWRSPSALHLPIERDGAIDLFACNARGTLAFFAFPPLPPFASQALAEYAEPPLVVRLDVTGPGDWGLDPGAISVVTGSGQRVVAGLKVPPPPGEPSASPCSCFDSDFEPSPNEPLRGVGGVGAWLAFALSSSPDQELRLELGGISRDGIPVVVQPVDLRPGSRWFWFLWAP